MSNIAIKAENLSKAYQLGEIGTGTISRDLERWYARIRGKEDPFLRIGEANDRTSKGHSDVVWSLKDINFEIEQGDAVGIIGRNGAGKSTLLKVLSRVTSPTTGRITGKGRIASLLEVGTGFHPELTGRENIYLNGAILGMRKKEITRKFDEIVDFAGVERYIDTPVKRYSSGMYVRLAFAVAAHLESEILIVDEVLAVGDAEFQKKCLGKMGEVSKGEGRTVLFVSHNMGSVLELCSSGIVLANGITQSMGPIESCVEFYLSTGAETYNYQNINPNSDIPQILSASLDRQALDYNQIKCLINYQSSKRLQVPNIGFIVKNELGTPIFGTNAVTHGVVNQTKNLSRNSLMLETEQLPLHNGLYSVDLYLGDKLGDYHQLNDCLKFEITNQINRKKGYNISSIGSLNLDATWYYSENASN
ncbi:ABC transporter ATP-binding protein [Pedobacter sp. ASV28]|uniref:ABC transporter ATP-binding protein n=1 Tax=Pedobacter sp. ASV28 TaxID=2795123 RepID=UPI0018EBD3D1|nr:ABC transporter ATP-binding protein [Pedobacter sp. ASV28]